MTAPLGYPEKFGVLLDPQRGQAKLADARDPAKVAETRDPAKLGDLKPSETGGALGPSFSEQVANFVAGIDQTQKTGRTQAEEFAVGHSNDIHGTMIAVEQADISLRLLANVRNRAIDLYREVMRMGS